MAGGAALRSGSGRTAVAGEERLTGLRLVVLVQLQLFEEEVGARTHEGVRLGGEHRLDMAKFLVQAAKQIQHLAGLGDGVADVAQAIGELLQLGAVVRDAEVALNDAAELGLKENRALHLIVAEEALDVRPDGERRGIGLVDEVEDALVDGGVDPIGEGAVDLTPLGIAFVEWRRRANVADEAKLAEDGVEQAAPLAVVGVEEVEEDGDVVADVDRLNHGEGSRLRRAERERPESPELEEEEECAGECAMALERAEAGM